MRMIERNESDGGAIALGGWHDLIVRDARAQR